MSNNACRQEFTPLTKTFNNLTLTQVQKPLNHLQKPRKIKIKRTFSPKQFYRKQQVLVFEPSLGKYVFAIIVDFEGQGQTLVVSGGYFENQEYKTSWELVEPYDYFCVSKSELPNTTLHSMKAVTSQQARAEISQFRRGQENTEFFAFLDQELPQGGAVHYGQLKAPSDAGHCGFIVGPKATHFAELTHKYNLLFVWHDRPSGLFKVWGREESAVKDALRQLLFHKLKCRAEDDETRLRELIRAAETRYLSAEHFPRRDFLVSADI